MLIASRRGKRRVEVMGVTKVTIVDSIEKIRPQKSPSSEYADLMKMRKNSAECAEELTSTVKSNERSKDLPKR